MATEKDLVNAVRESLKTGGELARIKAEMRTEVIKLLDHSNKGSKTRRPKQSSDIILLNELVREYLDWMGYKYTSTVFIAESDLSKYPFDREMLTQGLRLEESDTSTSLPLLCGLVETFKNSKTT